MTSLGGHCAPLELQGFSANMSYKHLAALRPGHRSRDGEPLRIFGLWSGFFVKITSMIHSSIAVNTTYEWVGKCIYCGSLEALHNEH